MKSACLLAIVLGLVTSGGVFAAEATLLPRAVALEGLQRGCR